MILTRSPLRISLAGGGSDIPNFYRQDFGEVLSFSIDKYVYIAAHNYFSGGIRLSYSKTEIVNSIHEIEHPIFRNAMKHLKFRSDIEISSFADVPGNGTGLGSSSAFTVALIRALLEIKGTIATKHEIAKLACEIEINLCRDPIGKQDQFASSFGGINRFRFNPDNSVNEVASAKFANKINFLNNSFLLYYTGNGRTSNTILSEQSDGMIPGNSKYNSVVKIRDKVPLMEQSIMSEDLATIGSILDESWQLKKSLSSSVSNSEIDDLIIEAKRLGALGGKLVGAGGGGFLLLCVPSENRNYFQDKFQKLRRLPFSVSTKGVEVVYNDELGSKNE